MYRIHESRSDYFGNVKKGLKLYKNQIASMRIPVNTGWVDRRILVNYRVDPEVVFFQEFTVLPISQPTSRTPIIPSHSSLATATPA